MRGLRLFGLMAAALGLLSVVAGTGPATGQEPDDPAERATALLRLGGQTPALEAGQPFSIRVRLTSAPAGASLRVAVHERARTRTAFARTLSGTGLGRQLGERTVPATTDPAGTVVVTVPTRDGAAGDPAGIAVGEGVYPVTVSLLDDGGTQLDRLITHLVRLPAPAPAPPLATAVIVPIRGPAGGGVDRNARGELLATATVLRSYPSTPVTLAVEPAFLESLARSEDPADSDALGALRAVPGASVLPSTYVPLDEAAWIDADLTGYLDQQLDAGSAALTEHVAAPGVAWLADPSMDRDTAAVAAGHGYTVLVVPESALEPLDIADFPTALLQTFALRGVDGVTALAVDGALAEHVGRTADPVLDAHRLLADLAVLYLDEPPARRAAAVNLGDREVDPRFLDALLSGMAATRTLRATPVDRAVGEAGQAGSDGESDGTGEVLVRTLAPEPAARLGDFPDRYAAAAADVESYVAAVAPDPGRPAPLQTQLWSAADQRLNEDDAAAALEAVRDGVRASLAGVEAPRRQTLTLTARSGVVGLTLRNTTGSPVNVLVRLSGSKVDLPNEPDREVAVRLVEEVTRLEIDVRTRSSGDSPLEVTVLTPDGRIELDETRITIRSTVFSGVGLVLSIGALGFLVIWWGRHAATARRRRAGD